MTQLDSDVLIVGAGPTGLTLAIDLGRRGVRCTLIEQKERPAFLPKMERINARSMEIYRRMGLADKIRAAGLRSDCPMDVYIILKLTEPPLLHLSYPSVDEARAKTRASNDGTLPLEPYQLISQYTLEPFLKSVAETLPTVTVRFGCEFLSLRQDGAGRHRARPDAVAARRTSAPPIWSAATAAPARCAASSASRFPAKAICWGCARRCSAATSCSTACRSGTVRATAGTITSPTPNRRS